MDVGRLLATYRQLIRVHSLSMAEAAGTLEAKTFPSVDKSMPGLVIQSKQLTKQTQPLTPPFNPCYAHVELEVSLAVLELVIRGTHLKAIYNFSCPREGSSASQYSQHFISLLSASNHNRLQSTWVFVVNLFGHSFNGDRMRCWNLAAGSVQAVDL